MDSGALRLLASTPALLAMGCAGPLPVDDAELGSMLALAALVDVHEALLVGRAAVGLEGEDWSYLGRSSCKANIEGAGGSFEAALDKPCGSEAARDARVLAERYALDALDLVGTASGDESLWAISMTGSRDATWSVGRYELEAGHQLDELSVERLDLDDRIRDQGLVQLSYPGFGDLDWTVELQLDCWVGGEGGPDPFVELRLTTDSGFACELSNTDGGGTQVDGCQAVSIRDLGEWPC